MLPKLRGKLILVLENFRYFQGDRDSQTHNSQAQLSYPGKEECELLYRILKLTAKFTAQ